MNQKDSALCKTPSDRLVDSKNRPYFLWDSDTTLPEFQSRITDPEPLVSAYWIGKLLRQAKPDDVFTFVTGMTLVERWSELTRYLGDKREFWRWLLTQWYGVRLD